MYVLEGDKHTWEQNRGHSDFSSRHTICPMAIKLWFPGTQCGACIPGLEAALDMNVIDFEVYGDFILIICQSTGEWGIKSPKFGQV